MEGCVRRGGVREAYSEIKNMMMRQMLHQRAIDAALHNGRQGETSRPNVVDATTRVAKFAVDLMSETRVAAGIGVCGTIHIHKAVTDQRRERGVERFNKWRRARVAIIMCECFIQIA
jgi:6,7-dimethyl-8-ribityllumazine synthase